MEHDWSQRPNCRIYNAKQSNSCLAPATLKEHFLKMYRDGEYKNTALAKFKVKRARFDEKAPLPNYIFIYAQQLALFNQSEKREKQCLPHTASLLSLYQLLVFGWYDVIFIFGNVTIHFECCPEASFWVGGGVGWFFNGIKIFVRRKKNWNSVFS